MAEIGCMYVSHSVMSESLQPHGLQPTRLLCPWDSPGKNTGVGYHSLLQGILPTQGSNPSLLHCRQILYCLSHQGSLEYVVFTQLSILYTFHCSARQWRRVSPQLVTIIAHFITFAKPLIWIETFLFLVNKI